MARSIFSFTFTLAVTTLVLFALSPAPASAQLTESSTAALQKALQPFLNPPHNIDAAAENINKIGPTYPEIPSGRVVMYQLLMSPGINQPNVARLQLELAVRETPSDPEPWYMLGQIAIQDGRIAEASMDLDKAKQLLANFTNPKRKPIIEQQTNSLLEQLAEYRREWKDAEGLLRDILAKSPDDLTAHQRLARVLFWQGKATNAYDVLKDAKAIDHKKNPGKETFPTPEAVMAKYYYEFEGSSSTTGNAEKWFKAALANDPDNLVTRGDVAQWAFETGNIDFAKQQADEALRIEAADRARPTGQQRWPNSYLGRMLTGIVAMWNQDWKTAQDKFEKIIYEAPNDFMARNNLALALAEQKDDPDNLRKALAYAEANYRENSKNPEALSTLGWVRFKRGDFVGARDALQQSLALSNGNVNADTVAYLAFVLYYLDQKLEAKDLLKKVLDAKRPFSMKKESEKLWEKVKDLQKPENPKVSGAP